jgi:hypothetical protein
LKEKAEKEKAEREKAKLMAKKAEEDAEKRYKDLESQTS